MHANFCQLECCKYFKPKKKCRRREQGRKHFSQYILISVGREEQEVGESFVNKAMGPTNEAILDLEKNEAIKKENPTVALPNKTTNANM
jgi:hypothetical protein